MSFAKPMTTRKKAPGTAPGSSTTTAPPRASAAPRGVPSGAVPSTVRKAPLSSTLHSRPTAATAMKKAPPPSQMKKNAPPRTVMKSWFNPEVESAAQQTSALYHKYIQAEFIRLTAKDNLRKAKDSINKECTLLWVAESSLQNELVEAQVELDRLQFLNQYSEEKQHEAKAYERLLETLPDATEKLAALTKALERSQSHLELEGQENVDDKKDFEDIKRILDENQSAFKQMTEMLSSNGPAVRQAAGTMAGIRASLSDTLESYRACQDLMRQLHERAIREASVKMGEEPPAMTEISFYIPTEVQTPKLIDF